MVVPAVATSDISEMSRRDARRVALAAQGFTERRPTGRVDSRHFRKVLGRLGTVQLDSVNVLTRSHEIVFFARLGAYDRAALSRWLWGSHEVFEYWGHEASLHPVERHPLLRWRMAGEHQWSGLREVGRDNPEMVASALAEIRARGPVTVSDLDVHQQAPRREASWWGWGNGKRVVEHLFHTGDITAIRQNGFTRSYLLPEQWIPADVLAAPTPAPDDAIKELLLVSARCPRHRHRPRPRRLLPPQDAHREPAAGRAGGRRRPRPGAGGGLGQGRVPAPRRPPAPSPPAGPGAAVAVRLPDLGARPHRAAVRLPLPPRDLHAPAQAGPRLLRAAVPARRGPGRPGRPEGRSAGRRAAGAGRVGRARGRAGRRGRT